MLLKVLWLGKSSGLTTHTYSRGQTYGFIWLSALDGALCVRNGLSLVKICVGDLVLER